MKFYKIKSVGKSLSLYLLFLLTFGCSDFLDEFDPSNLTSDTFYLTAGHADGAIAAVYDNTRFIGGGAGIFSVNWQLLEAVTGQSTTQTGQNSDLNNLYGLAYDSNTGHIRNWFTGIYKLVANANLVIQNVTEISMDENQKSKIVAEALFLRAWAYFYAVRIWGDIPLITLPQTSGSEDFEPNRTPQSEVYDQIVSDLKTAEASGLPWTDTSGRVSLSAVKSLLAKVYLTMAGHPLNKTEYYSDAASKAKEVIDTGGGIGLFETYDQIRDPNLENQVEHIFSLQYNGSDAGNPMQDMLPNFQPVTVLGNAGTGSSVPEISFYNSFEDGDLRKKDRVGWFYTSYYLNGSGPLFDLGAPFIFKHFNREAFGTEGVTGTNQNNLDLPIIRFAEVLLIYAEASNETSGPSQDALEAVKKIRDRAQLTSPNLSQLTKDSFRELIWKERWHELCYEFKTWFDMVRLRKVLNNETGGFDNFVGHINLNSNQSLQEKHLLFPLPEQEMLNNPNLTPQNPGYN